METQSLWRCCPPTDRYGTASFLTSAKPGKRPLQTTNPGNRADHIGTILSTMFMNASRTLNHVNLIAGDRCYRGCRNKGRDLEPLHS